MATKKHVYSFDEGKKEMKNLLGGKGANLSEMTGLGIPVPPGFVITTETCIEYLNNNNTFPKGMMAEVDKAMAALEKKMGKKYAAGAMPHQMQLRLRVHSLE